MPSRPAAVIVTTIACALLSPSSPAAQAGAAPPLQAAAEAIIASVPGEWSVFAWSIDRGETLFGVNPRRIVVPASNNKVFTAIWALDALGPEHRFPTDLLLAGELGGDGVLRGDVVLRGSGDPSFGYPQFLPDPMAPLRRMASRLREHGVRAVAGRVIGDASAFDTVLVGPAWPRDTGGGASQYAPRVSGLAFQRNLLYVQLEPTSPGASAMVRLHPPVEEIPVVSTVRTGAGRALAVRREHDDTIHVRGAVAGRGMHRYGIGVADPAVLAAGALRRALLEQGIAVSGPAERGTTPPDAFLLNRHLSIPVGAMIAKLNQESDNFFAEHLFKATVAAAIGRGSYEAGGVASSVFFHEKAGVPYGELYQADGSGLSSHNRASAYALVAALVYAHRSPWSELFHRSLAMAGDRRGTLYRMFARTPASGNLHAKTGFIRGSRTLSGYVRTRDGQLVAFSFLYNGGNTNGARSVQEALGRLLAEYPHAQPEAGDGAVAAAASGRPGGEPANR